MSISSKPYLIRALYEWCCDSGQTAYLSVWVDEHTKVPMQYVKDQHITLNIGVNAVHNLVMENDWIHFSARFSGVSHEIWIPVANVVGIFARETGEGMGFEVEAKARPSVSSSEAKLTTSDDSVGAEKNTKIMKFKK